LHDAKSLWVPWFAGFLLIAVGWALVTPINEYPDEVDHVFRAASVVRGEVFPHIGSFTHGTGSIASIPVTLRNESLRYSCDRRLTQDSLCEPARPDLPASEIVATSEGRRFPLYYALVGWPSLAFPNRTGWLLMRLASAVLCSAFLASAASVLMSMRRRPLVLAAGLFVGLTPLALNLAGAVNPSGLEIASAVCFWAVVLAMVHGTSSRSTRQLVILGALSAVVLATCRETGCIFIVLAVVLSYLSADPTQREEFDRSTSAWIVLVCGGAATVAVAVWSVVFHSYVVFSTPPAGGTGFVTSLRAGVGHVGKLLQQMIGYLGYLTVPTPLATEVCWAVALLVVVGLAVLSSRRVGMTIAIGCVLVVVIPLVAEILTYSKSGLGSWQGRYTLPLAVGLPLLAVAPSRPKPAEWNLVAVPAVVVVLLVLWGQFALFTNAWLHVAHPQHWYIPMGDVLVALGAVVVLATVAWSEVAWFRRISRGDASPHPAQ
jgi:hypothetical protein